MKTNKSIRSRDSTERRNKKHGETAPRTNLGDFGSVRRFSETGKLKGSDLFASTMVSSKVEKAESGSTRVVSTRAVPNDAGGFAYAIMFCQGVGQLFPWNAFITASLYFSERFCSTPFRFDFENYLSISFTAAQTIGLAFTILYGARLSYHDKIVYPLIIYCVLFGLTTSLVLVNGINGNLLFWLTLFGCIGCGTSGAFLNAGFFSLSGIFPQNYTGAMMSGQGLAGLSVALTGLLTQAAGPMPSGYCDATDDSQPADCKDYVTNYSAFSYFLIATVVLGLCIVLFFILMKLPFTIFHLRGQGQAKRDTVAMEEPLLDAKDFENENDEESELQSEGVAETPSNSTSSYASSLGLSGIMKRNQDRSTADDSHYQDNPINQASERVIPFNESRIMTSDSDQDNSNHALIGDAIGVSTLGNIIAVFKIVKVPALTVFGVFAVTLALFPTLTIFLTSMNHCNDGASRFSNDLFVPFFFLLFNLGDFTGRVIAGNTDRKLLTAKNIHWAALARLIFVPLFFFSNLVGSTLPTVFKNDLWPILFMSLFALSNGYVTSCCMMMGPAMVDASDAPMAGNIMIFCLTAGLMCGSMLSFLVTLASQGHA